MANYGAELQATAATTETHSSLRSNASTAHRTWLEEIIFGCEATSADNAFLWTVTRVDGTTAGTATAVTPEKKDLADRAAQAQVHENFTAEPTTYAAVPVLSVPLNQKATFRWAALTPGSEIVTPATASAGVGIRTPTAPASICTVTIGFRE